MGDDDFDDLVGFLQDAKPEVRRLAAEGVLAQTECQEFLEYCTRKPRSVARPLLRLAESADAQAAAAGPEDEPAEAGGPRRQKKAELQEAETIAGGKAALQALVNLSAVPAVRDELVSLGAPRRCAEALRSGWLEGSTTGLSHWQAMLLANVTTVRPAQETLAADEGLLRFLLAAYVAKAQPPSEDGGEEVEDPMQSLGKVIGNVCALAEGRAVVAGGDKGPGGVASLLAHLGRRERRPDVLSVMRNLCVDKDYHAVVCGADLLARMSGFLYPWEKAEASSGKQLPAELRERLAQGGCALTGEAAVRSAAAGCVLGLCRTAEGRAYLRGPLPGEILRAWAGEEQEPSARDALQAVLKTVDMSEDEVEAFAAGGGAAPPPAGAGLEDVDGD
mmetsp:Transcript_2405/g.6433  ORF Transcript_2405/g.6433 Transcript_2405/m.6433 type:complete len:390 (-) Transcript_2405:52-1221(-)